MRLQAGLTHRWLTQGTSIINPAEMPPRLPPDQLIDRWPHEDHPALKKHPIPMPSQGELKALETEANQLSATSSLDNSPTAKKWVARVMKWFKDLVQETGANDHAVHLRFRACIRQWEKICSYLPPALAQRILNIIRHGYKIKWLPEVKPEELRHDCEKNPPMMKTSTDETWKSFAKMMKLGCLKPYDATKGKPPIICPVFFVDEGGKLRIVHNLKWLNGNCDPAHFPVWLETIERMRGIFPRWGYITVTDFSNTYFHTPFEENQHHWVTDRLGVPL